MRFFAPALIAMTVMAAPAAAAQKETETVDRTVDTHVKTLRAKLRQVVPDADPIRTHRGLGYSLEAGA